MTFEVSIHPSVHPSIHSCSLPILLPFFLDPPFLSFFLFPLLFVFPTSFSLYKDTAQSSEKDSMIPCSPDGQYVMCGSQDGSVYIWNSSTTRLEKVLKEHRLVSSNEGFSLTNLTINSFACLKIVA